MGKNLKIAYRDEGGYVAVEIPPQTIQFLDCEVYFDNGEEEFRIKTEALVAIEYSAQ